MWAFPFLKILSDQLSFICRIKRDLFIFNLQVFLLPINANGTIKIKLGVVWRWVFLLHCDASRRFVKLVYLHIMYKNGSNLYSLYTKKYFVYIQVHYFFLTKSTLQFSMCAVMGYLMYTAIIKNTRPSNVTMLVSFFRKNLFGGFISKISQNSPK